MQDKLNELKARLLEINDLQSAAALLVWDQATYMPPGGGEARGRQLATLSRLAHEKFTDAAIGHLLDDLQPYGAGLPYDSDDAALLRVARYDFERAIKLPPAFVAELSNHSSRTYDAWVEARPANDFSLIEPYLEKTVELSRRYADYFPGYEHVADPLIEAADRGFKASTLRDLFARLRAELVPLVQAITAQPAADNTCLLQSFPEDRQLAFGLEVIKRLGYDFARGRQDKVPHPFMIKFSLGDVRITTRVQERDLGDALFSTIHESGHAMYEQGIRRELEGTPLADGVSAGVHESQSRLWENIVGRSRGFWEFFYPRLQQVFPGQLGAVGLDTFYRAINRVQRSLIRVDADEVTYNLHVILRFDIELALLEGRLAVRDLPDFWNSRYQSDLGLTPPDYKNGVLQDMHWFSDVVGGEFQGYTLGNILAAQYYAAALKAKPGIPDQIRQGNFAPLHDWLAENIYQHGRKFTADELTQRATGKALTIEPYVAYLKSKYGELYKL